MKKCIVCKQEFKPNSGRQLVCSDVCRQERNREIKRDYSRRKREREKLEKKTGKKANRYKEKTCAECGQKFKPNTPHQKICSKKCREDRRKWMTRENSKKHYYRMKEQLEKRKEIPTVNRKRIKSYQEVKRSDLYRHVFKDDNTATKLAPVTETILEEITFRLYFEEGKIECYR